MPLIVPKLWTSHKVNLVKEGEKKCEGFGCAMVAWKKNRSMMRQIVNPERCRANLVRGEGQSQDEEVDSTSSAERRLQ